MSDEKQQYFVYVRAEECEALKRLKPSTAKLWIAIRYGRNEGQPFSAGSRDFKETWGLGRDAVASGLNELVAAGLLKMVREGGFKRGARHTFKIVHTKAFSRNTAGKPANSKSDTAGLSGKIGRKTRQLGNNTVGLSGPSKDTSSTSSRKSEEEEVSLDREADAERDARVRAHKESMRRIGRAANVVALPDMAFIEKAGGPKPADLLARSYERGNLTALQLRARLVESEAWLGEIDEDGKEAQEPAAFAKVAGVG